MYFLSGEAAFNNMGYSMSRLNINSDLLCGNGTSTSEADGSSHRSNKPLNYLDHEIAQLTKLKSEPHDHLSRVVPGKRELPVSTVKMLAGREGNYSGRGRFSTADCCHVLSRLTISGKGVFGGGGVLAQIWRIRVLGFAECEWKKSWACAASDILHTRFINLLYQL